MTTATLYAILKRPCTTATLGAFCRVRSYLASTHVHGLHAIDAIHTALARDPWLPTSVTG